MIIVYSDQKIPEDAFKSHSLFLAGPTPRSISVPSWRPEALEILASLKYKGTVFVPEWTTPMNAVDYVTQIDWETKGLKNSMKIVFWVPRIMESMPALTTNVEFGYYIKDRTSSCLYGRPDWAQNCKYLDTVYTRETGKVPYNNLKDLLLEATWDA